jgi:RNA polymerase sigma-70 factor (ECF subfamily)
VRTARKTIRQRRVWRFIRFGTTSELLEYPAATASQEVSEALRITYRILAELPADERIAFALRHVDGMELCAVAEVTGVSLSTVKRRLTRAHASFVQLAEHETVLSAWLTPESFLR